MKRLILVMIAALCVCTTLFALQPTERNFLSPAQVDQMEKSIARSLESNPPTRQIEAAMLLHRAKALAPTHEWDRCIIPLMGILNRESNEASARLLAALLLHELRSERGDFAISRNALFTDDQRVKRYCTILARTRLLEKSRS
jgi:hypothetical protein